MYDLWFMVYGLWFMVYGLWFMVFGFWVFLHLSRPLEKGRAKGAGWIPRAV